MMAAADLFPEVVSRAEELPDDRYTTPATMDLCMKLAGVDGWDLDAAACTEAHWATRWYGAEVDGLTRPWLGRTWVNPPYSKLAPWLQKAWDEIHRRAGPDVIAMLLPANRTEQPFWHEYVESHREGRQEAGFASLSTHFLPGRQPFGYPGNPRGIGVSGAPFACVLLVWRRP